MWTREVNNEFVFVGVLGVVAAVIVLYMISSLGLTNAVTSVSEAATNVRAVIR